jgi:hypothetical protein
MEQLKRLPKEIINEGITLEMVNSPLFYKKSSPVILNPDEEIVNLICINSSEKIRRYWISDSEGNYVKDGGKMLVVAEKEARIGRARYLLLYSEKEQQEEQEKFYQRVEKQAEAWKEEVNNKLESMYFYLQAEKCIAGVEYDNVHNLIFSVEGYVRVLKANRDHYEWKSEIAQAVENWQNSEMKYTQLKELREKGDYCTLVKLFRKIPDKGENPIFTAHFDNPVEMEQCRLIFGKEAIDHWNGDMFKIAVAIYLSRES